MTNEMIKEHIIYTNVLVLNKIGFPNATKENIFTDNEYMEIFKEALKNNVKDSEQFLTVLNELIATL